MWPHSRGVPIANHDDELDVPLPLEHAGTILHLMKLTADVRGIEGLDYDAVRWILDRCPGLRDKDSLDGRLVLGKAL